MKILHLSDLHFGTKIDDAGVRQTAHHFVDEVSGEQQPGDLVDILVDGMRDQTPDIVVATGDLGWSGIDDDYKYARDFFDGLRASWPSARFTIVPGNHDVNVAAGLDDEQRQNAFIDFVQWFHGDRFPVLYPYYDSSKPAARHRLVSFDYVGDKLLVVGVNTAASLNALGDPVVVSPASFAAISSYLRSKTIRSGSFRLMAMHHHLLPFVEPDWGKRIDVRMVHERPDVSMVANSARLQSWLSTNSFSMVLHGHRHQFHSREDVLWRGDQASGRRLLIVGAGSAGVESHEVGRVEPLSVNTIDAHELTSMSWAVGITHRPISTKEALPLLEAGTSRWSDVGPPGVTSPVSIVATNMAAAHQAIYRQTAGKVVRNFVSVVETAQYCHPPTTAIGERQATADEVHHSFVALHPEWRAEHGWDDPVWIDNFLSRLGESYRIQHGPRMFAPPRGDFGPSIDQRPIRCALQALERSDTRGYLGLYDPARDLGLRRDPLPGLVGVQFIPSRGRAVLDLVATFRNLELSFWWTVNMLEMIRIQEWACHRVPGGRYSPGTITFFAAVAEWREDPRPMFISSIDQMPMNQMVELAANVAAGGGTSKIILLGKLKEKLEHTTGINIQYQGLENLHAALSGMSAVTPVPAVDVTLLSDFLARIDSAVDCLKSAVDTPAYRDDLVVKSRNALKSAIGILERTLTSSTQPQPGQ